MYANSGHLVSAGDKKSQMLSELMTLEGDLVSDLLCAETLGPSFMQKKKKKKLQSGFCSEQTCSLS